jgi:hypothetical protein
MVAEQMMARGVAMRRVDEQLDVDESTPRYRLNRGLGAPASIEISLGRS